MILPHAERWRHLDLALNMQSDFFSSIFDFDDEDNDTWNLNQVRDRLPLLKSLAISSRRSLVSLRAFAVAPRLRHATFTDLPPELPWSQLTTVVCTPRNFNEPTDGATVHRLLGFLSLCAPGCQVTAPSFRVSRLQEWASQGPEPALRIQSPLAFISLCLDRESADHDTALGVLKHIFHMLVLPQCTMLSLDIDASTSYNSFLPFPTDAFLVFAGYASGLSTLLLRHVLISLDDLATCVGNLPALEHLFVQDTDRSYEARDAELVHSRLSAEEQQANPLVPITDNIVVCDALFRLFSDCETTPRLRVLDLAGFFDAKDVSAEAVLDLFRARRALEGHFRVTVSVLGRWWTRMEERRKQVAAAEERLDQISGQVKATLGGRLDVRKKE
ncbi:F-box domain-containing protein [Mycena chlorophos]|uniref:F-box domain-containing protein n=1 Tax=Mycena chlorophos TaxID=658473 RepID=A0A8H6VQL1_MYCCL|nr:F-box domain-containing protein [Mycena chlorophos]